jgi:hypothetical protein
MALAVTIRKSAENGGSVDHPVRLGENVQLQDLKCGYYDPGFLSRDQGTPVQAGCYYHVIEKRGVGDMVTTAAYSGAVPSSTSPEPDPRWPEEAVLRGAPLKGLPPAGNGGSGKETVPVPPRPPARGSYPEAK